MIISDDPNKTQQKPEILRIELIASTAQFQIEQLTLRFSNGQIRKFERFVQHPKGIVMIVPMLDCKTILLTREYCAGIEDYTLSFPKGRVELSEDSRAAALRELREEAGFSAKRLDLLQTLTHSPSYSSTETHIFLARDLYESPLIGDEPEPIEVIPWQLNNIQDLLHRSDFHEGRALNALFLTQHFLNRE